MTTGDPSFRLMKKNDILRVRIDAGMLAALKRVCEESGCSLSQVLRESIARELTRRNEDAAVLGESLDSAKGPLPSVADHDQRACAQVLSSILLPRQVRTREDADMLERRRRKIAQLLEALFRALYPAGECAPLIGANGATHRLGLELAAIRSPTVAYQPQGRNYAKPLAFADSDRSKTKDPCSAD